jgi:hypothetical protein
MYRKQKLHRGKLVECKQCLAKMAAQDPAFAQAFAKAAAAEKPKRGR